MADVSPITNRYKMLQKADFNQFCSEQPSSQQKELDRLYVQLMRKPILCLSDALEKLAFADHCLTEEHDIKEASNLIREVSAALLVLHLAGTPTVRTGTAHEPSWYDDPV